MPIRKVEQFTEISCVKYYNMQKYALQNFVSKHY